jgi:hypothetical protein
MASAFDPYVNIASLRISAHAGCEGDLQRLGKATNAQLRHQARAMHLDRPGRTTKIIGYGFIRITVC